MKKILVINIGTEIGGIEKCLINFLKYLKTRDCSIDLMLWKPRGPLFDKIPDGINILDNPGPGSLKSILKAMPSIKALRRLKLYVSYRLKKRIGCEWNALPRLSNQYDIAISYCQNGLSPYYLIDNVNASEKYMFYHHGSYDKTDRAYKTDKEYYEKYTKIITVSRANREMLLKYFPSINGKIEVLHNFVDAEDIRKKSFESCDCFNDFNGLKLVTVGRLSEEKGQLIALKTAKVLKEKHICFKWVFVGDGHMRDEYEKYCIDNDLSDCCRFVGAKENPYPFIRISDIYVQTSSVEADPTTIHEAVILNKCIVASGIPAIREALAGYKSADICEISADAFAKAIINADYTAIPETEHCASDLIEQYNRVLGL